LCVHVLFVMVKVLRVPAEPEQPVSERLSFALFARSQARGSSAGYPESTVPRPRLRPGALRRARAGPERSEE
ncbi:MAG: hypothetical protein AAF732_22155, partial [Pseudomonadota bacterium]